MIRKRRYLNESMEQIKQPMVRELLGYIRNHAMDQFLKDHNFDSYEEYVEDEKAYWEDMSDEYKARYHFNIIKPEDMFSPETIDFRALCEQWVNEKNLFAYDEDFNTFLEKVCDYEHFIAYCSEAKRNRVRDINFFDCTVYDWLYWMAVGVYFEYKLQTNL